MKSLYLATCAAFIACAIFASTIQARDLAYNNFKSSSTKQTHQMISDPEVNWPLWIGVQQTDRILTSFDCEGTFGLGFTSGKKIVPEWRYRSFESPPESGADYLFGGAVWIGGIVNGDTLVSVGVDGWNSARSMYPTATVDGYLQGSVTNFEYKSSFSLRAEYSDTIPEVDRIDRPSDPLDIVIGLRSHIWREEAYDQAVVYDMVITNIGANTIEKGFVGLYMDADICFDCSGTNGFQDDLSGSIPDEKIAYSIDNDGDFNAIVSTPKAFAVKFLYTSFNPEITNFNWWISNGNPAFDFGPRRTGDPVFHPFRDFRDGALGTPGSAEDKYYILSNPEWDYDQFRTRWIMDNDSTWVIYQNPKFIDFGVTFARGSDTRFLLSVGPFDLAPDSSTRIIFTTFTGENIHTVPDNMANLPDDPDAYQANLDFSDLIATAESAEQVMTDSLLDPLAPAIGLHLQSLNQDSVVLEWDPWVFDDVEGYELYITELDHNDLPYPGVAAPWLEPDQLNLYTSLPRTYQVSLDNLLPEQFYFAQLANRTSSAIGVPSPPIIFTAGSRATAPGLTKEFFFYQNNADAVIDWTEPPGIDIDHYNIYRFENNEQAAAAYHTFYDQGLMSASITPKDNFEIDDKTYYYYAMEPQGSVDSSQTSFIETAPFDEAVYLISAVSKRGFESHFSKPITTFIASAKEKDFLVFTNSVQGLGSFSEYADIVSFYQNVLSGYEFDFYSVSDTTGGLCQPDLWPCIDWRDFMPYRYIIIDDKLSGKAWSLEYEDRESGFSKYLLSGGNLIYFGRFSGLREVYPDEPTGNIPIDNPYINRFFGIDSIYIAGLTQYTTTYPRIDTSFGFISAKAVLPDAPSIAFDSSSVMFNEFLDLFWPINTAPAVAAFHPSKGTVTHNYNSLYPTTSIHDGKAVGIRTETGYGLTYLFGFHLWYMDAGDSRKLIQWILDDIVTDVDQPTGTELPRTFSLHQNFPNPFNPSTTITFDLPKRTNVDLDIFNILGRKVRTLHTGSMTAGKHSLVWDGQNESGDQVTSGIYFYRLQTEEVTISKKMLLLK